MFAAVEVAARQAAYSSAAAVIVAVAAAEAYYQIQIYSIFVLDQTVSEVDQGLVFEVSAMEAESTYYYYFAKEAAAEDHCSLVLSMGFRLEVCLCFYSKDCFSVAVRQPGERQRVEGDLGQQVGEDYLPEVLYGLSAATLEGVASLSRWALFVEGGQT